MSQEIGERCIDPFASDNEFYESFRLATEYSYMVLRIVLEQQFVGK